MRSHTETVPASSMSSRSIDGTDVAREELSWRSLYRIGGTASLIVLLLMPVQIILYIAYPPPATAAGFFALMQESSLVGLIGLDLLYMVTVLLMGVVVLALCVALRGTNRSLIAIALFLIVVATAIYFASSIAFEMLQLSSQYATSTNEAQRSALLAVGEGMLATYKGSAYDVSYVLSAITGLILAITMLRSDVFDRKIAYAGLVMNVMSLIPATAGMIGFVLAFASLVPTVPWLLWVTRRLYQLGRSNRE